MFTIPSKCDRHVVDELGYQLSAARAVQPTQYVYEQYESKCWKSSILLAKETQGKARNGYKVVTKRLEKQQPTIGTTAIELN